MRRSGFTLIELAAVVLILSIVGAAVAIKVQGPLSVSSTRELVDRVRDFDGLTRLAAVENDRRLLLEVDLDLGELRRTDPDRREPSGEPLALPAGFRIGALWTLGERHASSTVTVPFSPGGLSRSYGLQLEGPGGGRWIVVAGLTGQCTECEGEAEVEKVLGFEPGAGAGAGADAR